LTYRGETWLWLAQRASAAVLALCVVVHLATIIYAVQGGLTAAESLGGTGGNAAWLAFYSVFVLAVSVHAPMGLRTIFIVRLRWRGRSRDVVLLFFAASLAWMGLRAVFAMFA
jgi:fumarate reductase subunit C